MQINKVQIDKLEDVFQIITECHLWLSEKGLEQWKYYTLDIVKKKFEDHDVFIMSDSNEPIASVFLSMEKPYYYTEEDNNYFADPKAKGDYKEVITLYKNWGFNEVGSVIEDGVEYKFMEK